MSSGNGRAFTGVAKCKWRILADGAEAAEYILDKIRTAKRPVFMIGHGASGEAEKMLTDLARAHHIPVITSVLARSALSFDDP